MALFDDIGFLVGGGVDQAQLELAGFQAEEAAFRDRAQGGSTLLDQLVDLQRDPFSLVPALQAFAASGGGTLGSATALGATGGKPQETGLGPLIQQLIDGLSEFALGVPATEKLKAQRSAGGAAQAAQTTAAQTTASATTAGSQAFAGRKAAAASPTVTNAPGLTPAQPASVGTIDRTLLPQNIQDAITQFEQGMGDVTTIGQAVFDQSLTDANRSIQPIRPLPTARSAGAIDPTTDPSVLERSIRSAIGRRQSMRGARNQFTTSAVGKAVNGR